MIQKGILEVGGPFNINKNNYSKSRGSTRNRNKKKFSIDSKAIMSADSTRKGSTI
jgi:hypothetical protein